MYSTILFLPLIGFLFCGILGVGLKNTTAKYFTVVLMGLACLLALNGLFHAIGTSNSHAAITTFFPIFSTPPLQASWGIYHDTLTSVMVAVVCTISFLVHLYSLGYMAHDKSQPRFFAYLSLFTFAMLALVTAPNLIQLFFGWEGVGLASYLLIGFWHEKDSANKASIKAFVVNRVGDFGLIIGIALIFYAFGSVQFATIFKEIPLLVGRNFVFFGRIIPLFNLIGLLMFAGAMGKSAQILLHTWLPDAMEGPTPVSALIHAATMVTAGVFLIARLSPLYEHAPLALDVILFVGATTAFFAATIAFTQNDIKRVIAYSTCSQLGYMFAAMGAGAYNVGTFHLFTHACFKALLFLCAGSVIHAMGDEQDMRKMGGLWRKMPITWLAMIAGTLAITGFPLTSGFYSKDAIIEATFWSSSPVHVYAYIMTVLAALLTSFYSWRLIFMTFHGKTRASQATYDHAHESPGVMSIPLILLGFGSLFLGFLFQKTFIGTDAHRFWGHSLVVMHEVVGGHMSALLKNTPTLLMLVGLFSAWLAYLVWPKIPSAWARTFGPLYRFLYHKWFFDELYAVLFVRPVFWISNFVWQRIDLNVIDRLGPNALTSLVRGCSKIGSRFQTGYIYHYAFMMTVGLLIFMTYILWKA